MTDFRLSDVCVVACAEAWRGDGELLASPIGLVPSLGARLARATFAPELALVDLDGWIPYRTIFELVWSGRRHVMMGASQIDRHGNQNISCIGPFEQPKAMLIGMRGAPGNTICHATSYWVPNHSPRVFVPSVDVVCGVGTDRAAALGRGGRFHALRRVITNLGVFDFETPDRTMRVRSIHPGRSVRDVIAATGFPLTIPDEIPTTRGPTDEELRLIRDRLDPEGLAAREVSS